MTMLVVRCFGAANVFIKIMFYCSFCRGESDIAAITYSLQMDDLLDKRMEISYAKWIYIERFLSCVKLLIANYNYQLL